MYLYFLILNWHSSLVFIETALVLKSLKNSSGGLIIQDQFSIILTDLQNVIYMYMYVIFNQSN